MIVRSRSAVVAAVLAVAAVGPLPAQPPAAPAPTPVVIAVDTSRSLAPAALASVVGELRGVLTPLEAETPAGLLAFDDSPRWLAGPDAAPSEVIAALDDLSPQGNFTLLNDALFTATRALPEGGVILLVTDGRDENSAVLVDDIARRCEAQNVRILSLGVGGRIEEKALRRLALVSDGEYLGTLGAADGAALSSAMASARSEVSATRRAAVAEPAPAAQPAQPAGPAATPVATPRRGLAAATAPEPPVWQRWWLWAILAVVALALLALGRRRAAPADVPEEDGGREEEAADEAEAGMIRLELAQVPAAEPQDAPEVTVDTAVFQQMTVDERLEHTRVMSNHGVLVMRRLGERPRTFLLDRDKAFAVGRDHLKNTLSVPDPALSAQHFKIVPRGDVFYFVDLESTNGSYINGRRCGAKRLRHLDQLRAGQVEFEFQSYSNV